MGIFELQGDECDGLRKLAHVYLEKLADAHVWPSAVRDITLSGFLEDIKKFTAPEPSDVVIGHIDLCGKCLTTPIDLRFREAVVDLKEKAGNIFAGVCLDCLKAGGKSEGNCRFKHD